MYHVLGLMCYVFCILYDDVLCIVYYVTLLLSVFLLVIGLNRT